ncbi:MAG: DEAD/DEAH box helicase [Alphaproteobacteria bacterium]|nr:DEAD/DEAH box helicase [Alphaproteobacteria bacterium]
MIEFDGVVPVLAQALTKRGYETLTPVQNAVLAPSLRRADALVSAQTGSGKTIAFGMAMAGDLLGDAERFTHAATPLALIVAPTRELALQVKRELQWLYEMTGAAFASCVGGMDMRDERRALQNGAHIVVGTPGRLRDHIERGSFNPSALKAVVLDEADEMLDLGFRDDLEFILDAAPKERRTLMFSATVPKSIETLAKRYQRDAVRVNVVSEQKQHLDIDYRALMVAPKDQENAIINVLRFFDAKNALVFCATRAAVNHLTSRFNNRGFAVVALSGELSQNERSHALQAMRDGRARVCVATDVAARGIDLPNLELVIHADIPKTRETLLHRSGRTGRAGRKGVCALIVPHNARRRAERLLDSATIDATWETPPTADDVIGRDRERLLSDPSLTEPLSESEAQFAQELLSRHSVEQIAGAFARQHLSSKAAPEELLDVSMPTEPLRKQRDDFKNGVWFSLSVGREQSAEPRWLLPLLCRAGNLTKADIGPIRIQPRITYVELAPQCVDQFLSGLGPNGTLEKTISVIRLDGAPPVQNAPDRAPYDKSRPKRERSGPTSRPAATPRPEKAAAPAPVSAPAPARSPDRAPNRSSDRSSDRAAAPPPTWVKPRTAKPHTDAPSEARPQENSEKKRPWSKTPKKMKGKMFKPKPARATEKKQGAPSSASAHSPLKRKPKP